MLDRDRPTSHRPTYLPTHRSVLLSQTQRKLEADSRMIAAERRRLEKLRSRTSKATIGNAHVETVRGGRCRALLLPRCVGATLCSSPHTTRNRRRCRTVPCHAVPCCAVLPATPRALPHRHAACGACHASRHEHVVLSRAALCHAAESGSCPAVVWARVLQVRQWQEKMEDAQTKNRVLRCGARTPWPRRVCVRSMFDRLRILYTRGICPLPFSPSS